MYKNNREKVVIDLMDCVRIVMGILVRNHWQSDLSPSMGFNDFLLRNWCLIGLVINRRPLIRDFLKYRFRLFPVPRLDSIQYLVKRVLKSRSLGDWG
ncbi:hypothetical protein CDAR_232141 [Caerostris darwini]|uniref:Maturase K n=1 Tax=Caerostris darwini TaxID=1538125 RepID=A0AAV4U9D2_9ARAC|nr:hypothetical protein CDAR_232141 [Caerostris darwini]